MPAHEAFTRCPICKLPYQLADSVHHFRVPCRPVEFRFGRLVAIGAARPYVQAGARWTALAFATVELDGHSFSLECYLRTGRDFPDAYCDARRLDAAILGRLLWPAPGPHEIADAALAHAEGALVPLPIDLVFVDPGRDYFLERPSARTSTRDRVA